MGDYTLCHFHFTLKEETPKETANLIVAKLKHEAPILNKDADSLLDFFPLTSAYHHVQNFVETESMYSEFYGEFEGLRVNTIFQVKYSRGIQEFVDFIKSWVITDESTRGCIGWTLSEYASSPTYLFVDIKEDPKDKYIEELENKCKELVEKLKVKP